MKPKKMPQAGKKTKAAASSSTPSEMIADRTRATEQHIFFWHGPLSNWFIGTPYSGARALDIMIPRLDALGIAHPPSSALSTCLLSRHTFNCGEQWMMACKGWLFEREVTLLERSAVDLSDDAIAALELEIHSLTPPPRTDLLKHALYTSTLCSVLRTESPREQKALGRQTEYFDPQVWDTASVPVVVACSIARAEVDHALKEVYLKSNGRKFVEGSPSDRIWGVGIKYDNQAISKERNWKGENRLGVCHGIARDVVLVEGEGKGFAK